MGKDPTIFIIGKLVHCKKWHGNKKPLKTNNEFILTVVDGEVKMIFGTEDASLQIETASYGTILFPQCLSSFELEMRVQDKPVKYLNSEGIITTRENLISSEEYVLTIEINDIEFTAIQQSLSELSIFTSNNILKETFYICPLESSTFSDPRIITANTFVFNSTDRVIMKRVDEAVDVDDPNEFHVDFTSNTITFNSTEVGKTLCVVVEQGGAQLGTIGSPTEFEKFGNVGFQGKFITTTGDGPYILSVPRLERISGPNLLSNGSSMSIEYLCVRDDVDNSDRKPFRIYTEGVEGQNIGDEELEAILLIAPIPEEWTGSFLNVAGQLQLINNPDELPIEEVTFTLRFDFAILGTEEINIVPDTSGFFSAQWETRNNLAFPETGFFTATLDETGKVFYQQNIFVPEPAPIVFEANLVGGDFEFVEIEVNGTGDAGSTVSFASVNLGGLFDGASVTVQTNNTWRIKGFLPASVTAGTSYTITVSHPGFSDIVLNETVGTRNFAPTLTFSDFYKTGLESRLIGSGEYRANQEYTLEIKSPDLTFYDETAVSDNEGNLSWTFTIPTTEQGKALTWTFEETSTTTIIVLNNTAPQYNINIGLTVDTGQGELVAGEDSVNGTVDGSEGHLITINLKDSSSTIIGSRVIEPALVGFQPYSVPIGINAVAGNFSIEAVATIHNTAVISPIPISSADIKEGLEVEIDDGIIYPTKTITFSGTGPAGATIDLDVFSTPYSTTASAIDKTWSIMVTVGGAQATGPYVATVTTPALPSETRLVNFSVVDPVLTLDECPTELLFSGPENPPMYVFMGSNRPDRDVTLTFTGLGGLLPVVLTPTLSGNWTYQLSVNWLNSGVYSITFDDTVATPIVCAGNQEGDIVISGVTEFVQGDTGNSVLLRGPENTILNVTVTGDEFNTFETNQSLLTNGAGFATLNLADIPIFTQVPETGIISVSTNTGTNSKNFPYSIEARVPITIVIGAPSTTKVGGDPVLFTNTAFTVTGNIPENGVYGFSSIGSTDSFTLDTVGTPLPDTYSATLVTSGTPGIAELTVSTIYQEAAVEEITVSPSISFEIPSGFITPGLYDLKIFSDPGELVQFSITGNIDGEIAIVTGTVPGSGEFVYSFDTSGLNDGQILTIIISNKYFQFEPQQRDLNGFGSGVPDAPIIDVNSETRTHRFKQREPRSLTALPDNQPIVEAGRKDDLVSDFILSWSGVIQEFRFDQYLVESYVDAISGWQLLQLQSDTTPIIITDTEQGYRIKALYEGAIESIYLYWRAVEGVFAKDLQSIEVNSDYVLGARAIPEEQFFFTFTNVRPEDEDQILSTEVNSDHVLETRIIPEEAPFFSIVTVRPEDEDQIMSTEVNSDYVLEARIIPEEAPFFTI